jgi:hypothetical protein
MEVFKLYDLWQKTHKPINAKPLSRDEAVSKARILFGDSYIEHLWGVLVSGVITNSITEKGAENVADWFVSEFPVGYDGRDVVVSVLDKKQDTKQENEEK